MRKNNVILIIQTVCMYLIHLPFYLILILVRLQDVSFETIETLFTVGLVAMLLMVPVCLISLIFALLILGCKTAPPYKTTMIIKLTLIPWYILNWLVCLLLSAGFLNPWLFLAVPVLVGVEVVITYIYMLSTSIHSVIYTLKNISAKKIKLNACIIVALVFHIIFCLDIVGAIMLHVEMKKQNRCNQIST